MLDHVSVGQICAEVPELACAKLVFRPRRREFLGGAHTHRNTQRFYFASPDFALVVRLLEGLISRLSVWTFPKQHLKTRQKRDAGCPRNAAPRASTDCNSWLWSSAVNFNFLHWCWNINSRRDRCKFRRCGTDSVFGDR